MTKDLLVLADEYAAATATFARALALKDGADSMSPIARDAGDKRAALAEAIALATQRDYYEQACERLAAELKAAQAPDCRTCEHLVRGVCSYEVLTGNRCTNGNQYQPAPAVVLWRTE